MKKYIISLVLLITASVVSAQVTTEYSEYEKRALDNVIKKEVVNNSLVLSLEDSKYFWPLYEEYNTTLGEMNEQYITLLTKYSDKRENITWQESMTIYEDMQTIKEDMLDLEAKYYKKMRNKIDPVKVVDYFNVEREIKLRVMNEVADEVSEVAALERN
ncbi:MAG: hypothetical protein KAG96_00565 [Ichthyobacteriaceae bacterium]|nr:hypothetical protein [Ichthyobacteriaceae bacterium]